MNVLSRLFNLHTIRRQLRFWMTFSILCIWVACASSYYWIEVKEGTSNFLDYLDHTTKLQHMYIERWMNSRSADIQTLASNPSIRKMDEITIQEFLNNTLENQSDFNALHFINTKGEILYTTDDMNKTNNITVEDREYFKESMRGNTYSSDVLKSKINGDYYLFFSSPVRNYSKDIIGLVLGAVKIDAINKVLNESNFGNTTETYLVNLDGYLLTESKYINDLIKNGVVEETARLNIQVESDIFKAALNKEDVTYAYKDYRGTKVFGSYHFTNHGKWIVIGEVDKNEVLEKIKRDVLLISLSFLLIMLFILLLILRLSTNLERPIHELLKGAKVIQNGVYTHKINLKQYTNTPKELAELCEAFNQVTTTIEENFSQIETNEQRYKALFDNNLDAVFSLNESGCFTSVNPACELMSGFSKNELLHIPYSKLIAPEHLSLANSIFSSSMSGQPEYGHVTLIHKNGDQVYLSVSTIPIIIDNKIIGIHCIAKDITEQKLAEEALTRAYNQQHAILDSITDAFIALDHDWRIIFMNQEAERYTGKDASKLLGKNFWDEFPALIGTKFEEEYRKAYNENVYTRFQEYFPKSNAWFDVRVYPSSEGLSIYILNITEQKQAEEALKDSEERFRLLTENLTDIISKHHIDGTFTFVSKAVKHVLGYRPEMLMGTQSYELIHPDDKHKIQTSHKKILVTDDVSTPTYRMKHANGHYIWVETTTKSLFHPLTGQPEEIISVTRDVTQRKEYEQAIKENEKRFRAIFDHAGIGIALVSMDGFVINSNRALVQLLGYEKKELEYLSFRDVTHPDDCETDLSLFRKLALQEIESYQIEKRYIRKDGAIIWARLTVSIVHDENNQPEYAIGMIEDISTQKRIKEELEISKERYKSLFSNNSDAVFSINMDGYLTQVNPKTSELTGYSKEELKKMKLSSLLQSEDDKRNALMGLRKIKEGISSTLEVAITHKEEYPVHVTVTIIPIILNEVVIGLYGIAKDITLQKFAEKSISDAKKRVENILESINDAFFTVDHSWNFTYCNHTAEQLLERSATTLIGKNIWEQFPDAIGSTFEYKYKKAMTEKKQVEFEEYFIPLNKWFSVRAYPSTEGLSVYFIDITSRKFMEDELRENTEQLDSIIKTLPNGVVITDTLGQITFVNDAACRILHLTRKDLIHKQFHGPTLGCKSLDGRLFDMEDHVHSKVMKTNSAIVNQEMIFTTDRNDEVILSLSGAPLHDTEGNIKSVLITITDITNQKVAEKKLIELNKKLTTLSMIDGLTGVYNRRTFDELYSDEWKKAKLTSKPLCSIMIDIDHFKNYNDTYGHQGGDDCLKRIANILNTHTNKPGNFVARYGGEEFIIILANTTADEGRDVAERIRKDVKKLQIPHRTSTVSDVVTVSIGVASHTPHYFEEAKKLIEHADRTLYLAKQTRDKVSVYKNRI
ncbi:PAS domain S-box protein [Bacillus sp. HMF5848]|uniref:PAS domain S-box protein n=1 Tax=Bacillus sp. HMF5848 TaxID=2495421 RepID=UPI00163A1FB3|nr:PAS domain S-box protein [Bacillus sp. HMF5848]